MDPVVWRLAGVTLVAAFLGLGACTTTPSRFYILSTLPAAETVPTAAADRGPVIGVRPTSFTLVGN